MKKKCESCVNYSNLTGRFADGWCGSPRVLNVSRSMANVKSIVEAREICDREGDGVFVFFEPRQPAAGAGFTQINREPSRTMAAAAGSRHDAN